MMRDWCTAGSYAASAAASPVPALPSAVAMVRAASIPDSMA